MRLSLRSNASLWGGVIRHGTNGIKMVRMFRAGRGRYAETLMDERIVFEGKKLEVPVVFGDDNLNSLEWWKKKHCELPRSHEELAAFAGLNQSYVMTTWIRPMVKAGKLLRTNPESPKSPFQRLVRG